MPNYFEANVLLFTLQALHVYWFHLFLMIGYRILTESTREASRQEYEGDSDGESEQIDGGAPRGNDGGGRGEGGAGGAAGKGKGKGEGADAAPGGGGGKGARQRRAA